MTRFELLRLLIGQAKVNGFEFRRWYVGRMGLAWLDTRRAILLLADERRYYALLFSHEFAQSFWKPGATMTFLVPAHTFKRTRPDGSIGIVTRKSYIKRSVRVDAWKYHLKELAMAEEPLRYMRRYLRIEEAMGEDG